MLRRVLIPATVVITLVVAFSAFVLLGSRAGAAPGDPLRRISVPVPSASGVAVSIAFDGASLFYTNFLDANLYRMDTEGNLITTVTVTKASGGVLSSGLGALTWDASRGMLWAGSQDGTCTIYMVNPVTGVATEQFKAPGCALTLDDGLTWDPVDDTLWYSNDISCTTYHLSTTGALLGTVDFCTVTNLENSGLAAGLPVAGVAILYAGTSGDGQIVQISRETGALLGTFASPGGRDEDLECDSNTFPGKHALWSKDAYNDTVTAFQIDFGTCGSPAGGSADLAVDKSDDPDSVVAGEQLTYTLLVTNNGPTDAEGVVVTDTLPSEVSFVSGTFGLSGTCTESLAVVTCDVGGMAEQEVVTVTIVVDVDASALGTINNTASVGSETVDPETSNNFANEDTLVQAPQPTDADVSVTKSDDIDPIVAGNRLTYTVTVANAGPLDAENVQLTDTLPAGVSFVSATPSQGTCGEASGVVTCNLGTIANGGNTTVTIEVDVDASTVGTITNPASISTTTDDTNSANDSTGEDTLVQGEADLSVGKSDDIDPIVAGNRLTYTVPINNAGPSDAQNVQLTDTLPAGVSFFSATPSQGTCGEAAGVVTCNLGTIANGGNATVTIEVDVDASTVGTITNPASVSTTTNDTNSANDSTSEDTLVQAPEPTDADVSVTKSDDIDPIVAGDRLTYTVTVANAGPADAESVQLTDTLPAGVSFFSTTPSQGTCGEAAGVVTCNLGTIANGGNATVTIEVDVDASTLGTITNPASVSTTTNDTNSANDSTSEDTLVQAQEPTDADIGVTKSDDIDPIVAGSLAYIVTVSNAGPADAEGVQLTDTLPAEVSFFSATPSQGTCGETGGVVTCNLGTIANGGAATVTIEVDVDASTVGTITNTASVSATTADPNTDNNSAQEDTLVQGVADVSVTKSDDIDPIAAGNRLTYTVTVANAGPADAGGVQLTDTLPAGVSFVSATPSQGTCGEAAGVVTCSLGTIANGGTATVSIAVDVDPSTVGTITNAASVSTTVADLKMGNNSAQEDTLVEGVADVSVAKSDDIDPIEAGSRLTYKVTVANGGPSDAKGVQLTDTLPVGVSFVSATPSQGTCGEAAGVVTCSLGTIANGGTVTVSIEVDVDASTVGTITNPASVSTTTNDPDTFNNSTDEDTLVEPRDADISVTKTDDVDPIVAGNRLTYTVTVSNAGPADAKGVQLTDTLPAGVSFVSATPSQGTCGEAGGVVTCSLGTIANGGSATVNIELDVGLLTLGTITNMASVTSSTPDPVPGNNATSEPTFVEGPADLAIVKRDDQDPVVAGQQLTYTLEVTNKGPYTAEAVMVTDTLPEGVSFFSATPMCGEAGGVVTCSLGAMVKGRLVVVSITVDVDLFTRGRIVNTASVTSLTADQNQANNSDSEATWILRDPDIGISSPPIVLGPPPIQLSDTAGEYMWVIGAIKNKPVMGDENAPEMVNVDLTVHGVPAGCVQSINRILPPVQPFIIYEGERSPVLFRVRLECHDPAAPGSATLVLIMTAELVGFQDLDPTDNIQITTVPMIIMQP